MAEPVVITCEHGGHEVPEPYGPLFAQHTGLLASHRGWDPGTLELAQRFAKLVGAPPISSTITRLLVDLNRSEHHRHLHFEAVRRLPTAERRVILDKYYHPYRRRVVDTIQAALREHRRVVHISVHSFTPELNGEVRNAEIGLLYDSRRQLEQQFCNRWREAILASSPEVQVRRNYPYRGRADGLTTTLRRRFPKSRYLGIELEVNQRLVGSRGEWTAVTDLILATFASTFAACAISATRSRSARGRR